MMNFKTIRLDRNVKRRVDTIILNRPDVLNAMNYTMTSELLQYFQSLLDSSCKINANDKGQYEPRVIVLKGEGRAFCAGMDIVNSDKAKPSDTGAATAIALDLGSAIGVNESLRNQKRISEMYLRMRKIKQPIVALVHGAACGAGFAFALASDVRLATKDFKANVAMAKIGLTGCDIGISYFLPRIVGASVAAELMMTGKFIYAERALNVGLLNSVHNTKEEMQVAGDEMVNQMLKLTETSLYLTKEGLQHSMNASSLEQAIAMEDRQQVLMALDPEFQARVEAFINKSKKSKN